MNFYRVAKGTLTWIWHSLIKREVRVFIFIRFKILFLAEVAVNLHDFLQKLKNLISFLSLCSGQEPNSAFTLDVCLFIYCKPDQSGCMLGPKNLTI